MSNLAVTFVGTATTIVRIGAFTLLTDPNFLRRGQRAYLGKGLWSKRLTDPSLRVDELPRLDAVFLSHLHGDHWDRVARAGLDRSAPVLTTTHAARRLRRSGFDTVGLAPWEEHGLRSGDEELVVRATPAVHARGVMGRLLPPVIGSLLEHRVAGQVRTRVHITGDTLTGAHIDEIARRNPDIDLAVVHLGGTRVLLHTVTMDDVQGVDYLRRLGPRAALPVHHGDYRVFRSPVSAFVDRAQREQPSVRLHVVERGETATLGE